jgi:hypothetical protein
MNTNMLSNLLSLHSSAVMFQHDDIVRRRDVDGIESTDAGTCVHWVACGRKCAFAARSSNVACSAATAAVVRCTLIVRTDSGSCAPCGTPMAPMRSDSLWYFTSQRAAALGHRRLARRLQLHKSLPAVPDVSIRFLTDRQVVRKQAGLRVYKQALQRAAAAGGRHVLMLSDVRRGARTSVCRHCLVHSCSSRWR